jgi:hypothetical protein
VSISDTLVGKKKATWDIPTHSFDNISEDGCYMSMNKTDLNSDSATSISGITGYNDQTNKVLLPKMVSICGSSSVSDTASLPSKDVSQMFIHTILKASFLVKVHICRVIP